MSIFKEFREFAIKGNALELAIGVIIGTSFGKIVNSLVTDILTPPIGFLTSGIDFKEIKLMLQVSGVSGRPEIAIGTGLFLQSVIDFVITAFAIFLLVKMVNKFNKQKDKEEEKKEEESKEVLLLSEIRDALKGVETKKDEAQN